MTVFVLPVHYQHAGSEAALYPVALQHQKEVILVDCGYPPFIPLIEQAMQQYGLSQAQLTGLLINHAVINHPGALFEIKSAYPHVEVYSAAAQETFIKRKKNRHGWRKPKSCRKP